jgi:hypothetical protein
MNSHDRQKAMRKILDLTKNPEIYGMVKGIFTESGAASESSVRPTRMEPISRVDLMLSLFGTAIAFITVLEPRTPTTVLVGTVFVALCLLFPAYNLPAILGFGGKLQSIRMRSASVASVAILVGTLGVWAFGSVTGERNGNIQTRLVPTVTIIYPEDARSTVFSVTNSSAERIFARFFYCHVNEALSANSLDIGSDYQVDADRPHAIEPGGDMKVSACLQTRASTPVCTDVTLTLRYYPMTFPNTDSKAKYRFWIYRPQGSSQYQWLRVGLTSPALGMCTHRPLKNTE